MSGKATSKLLNVKVNIPLLFVASIIPDIDILIPGLEHRGPTHSLITISLLFIPIFAFSGKRAIPYFLALTQHILIGDYLTEGTQLLWPVTTNIYGLGICIASLTNICIEWVLFLTSITIMYKTRDAWLLFQHHPSNLTLLIPILTVQLPTFLGFPLSIPIELILPHLTYLAIFTLSILLDILSNLKTI